MPPIVKPLKRGEQLLGFAEGKFTFLEVLDAQRALSDTRAQLNEALRNVSTTLIQPGLEFRLGVVALVERLWTGQDGRPVGVRLAG